MLYNEGRYYVLGFSETHGKIVTFRVDRMGVPKLLPEPIRPEPEGFDPVDYTVNIFSMYDGEMQTVRLLCENRLMDSVIDQFGDEFKVEIADDGHFTAEVEVSVSQTFYAWVEEPWVCANMNLVQRKEMRLPPATGNSRL